MQPRVLILQASEDAHGSYNGMMNCIFSAHRSSIPVDACVLGPTDSSFLQQASFITGTSRTLSLLRPSLLLPSVHNTSRLPSRP